MNYSSFHGTLAVIPEKIQKTESMAEVSGMITEVQWSELQRDPKQVARLADEGDVRVRRRDGAALLLVREDRAQGQAEGAIAAARALRNVLTRLPHDVAARALLDEFPWVDHLPDDAKGEFVRDFARSFQASAELGEWSLLTQTLYEWRSTALVFADPDLAKQLLGPVDGDLGPVRPPVDD
ncbi:hypothetical protein ACFXK0_04895 [Nocardia sp. NPDC059177]|uniref:hypothetical protein n=1 Tax=Nocardia sp. NPDC059177 TaxID=3346759 RepID=UPI0036764852